jgi:hypothetical protein
MLLLALAETANRHLLMLIIDETIRANISVLYRAHVGEPNCMGNGNTTVVREAGDVYALSLSPSVDRIDVDATVRDIGIRLLIVCFAERTACLSPRFAYRANSSSDHIRLRTLYSV